MKSMAKEATGRLVQALETAKKRGATAARLTFSQSRRIGCEFENGRLRKSDSARNIAIGIDVVVAGRRGRTQCNNLAALDDMLDKAVALAVAGSAAHFDAYPAPAAITKVPTWSQRTADLPRQSLIDTCQKIADGLKAREQELYIEAGGLRRESESVVVTSGGVCHESRDTAWRLGAWGQRTRDTDMLQSGFGRTWADVTDLYGPDAILEEMSFDLEHGQRIVSIPAGPTTVLLNPQWFGAFLWAVSMGVDGRRVAKGESPLKGRLGEQILDPCLTIVDDPHLPYHTHSSEISSEGIPTRKTPIFDRGVLQAFLYDLDSAGLAGTAPTGHDSCRPWSMDVAPGSQPSRDLLASIRRGIYVRDLIGFGQSNLVNGDFSSNVALGFAIENGQVTGRVKNVMIAGNIYDLLRSNVQLSSDKDPVERLPYAVIENVKLSAARR